MDPATELSNVGILWSFELKKEGDRWKINHWDSESLEGQDLQLTKAEAEKLLTTKEQTAFFRQEFKSKAAKGKAYVFKVKDTYGQHRLVGISAKNTALVDDYVINHDENTDPNNDQETIHTDDIFSDMGTETLHLGSTQEELIRMYGKPTIEKETLNDLTLQYNDAIYTLSKISNQIYQVEIIGEKVSGFYGNFQEVLDTYYYDPIFSDFYDETDHDEDGYHLILKSDQKTHTFTSDNEDGDPIKSIIIQDQNYY